MQNSPHPPICWASATVLAALLSHPVLADQPRQYKVEVAPQRVQQALKDFARQTALQVVYYTEVAEGISSPGATGTLSADDALKRILSGTGLDFVFVNERTVSIRASGKAAAGATPERSSQAAAEQSMLMVQADPRPAVGRQGPATEREAGKNAASAESAARGSGDSSGSDPDSVKGIPEILVRGRHTLNADIRRTEDDPQPYIVFEAEELKSSQALTLEEFLKTRLPMNAQYSSNSQTTGLMGNLSSINLRGVGAHQTLILIDGRRAPGVNTSGAVTGPMQPDINGIPMSAIERVEVLPSTASGIYGGGATGGVINIITRRGYQGFDLSAGYGSTMDAGSSNYRLDGSGGFTLPDGKTAVSFSASHSDSTPLLHGERDLTYRARLLQFRTNPGVFLNATTPPIGYTSNIRSQDGSNLVLDGGTPLNAPRTFVPVGYAGPSSDGGAALLANAGLYNIALSDDMLSGRRSMLNNPARTAANLSVRREFGSRLEAFADFSWTDNQGHIEGGTSITNTVTLAADSPHNPFTRPIVVRYPLVGLGGPIDVGSSTERGAIGLITRLPHDWTAVVDHARSRSNYSFEYTFPAASMTGVTSGVLNVMRDANRFLVDWSPYLTTPSPNRWFDADTFMRHSTLKLSGPVLRLPAGPVKLTALTERRDEETSDVFDSSSYYPSTRQRVTSYYLESTVPLVSKADGLFMLRGLDLQASARRDESTTWSPNPSVALITTPLPALTYARNEVGATRYTLGLRYQPLGDLALRASHGTGFVPPSVSQIVELPPGILPTVTVVDQKRGGNSVTYTNVAVRRGGNPDLQPEDSRSWSAGFILTPRALPGLRLSVDYSRLEKTSEIAMLSSAQLVELEDLLGGRVTRGALSADDRSRNYTGGPIEGLDATYVNVASARVQAYDFQLDYDFGVEGFGNFRIYCIGTMQQELARQVTPNAPTVEFVDFGNGLVKWRGNGGFSWSEGPWMLGWNMQYYHSLAVYVDNATTAQRTAAILNQGDDRIPSQLYHDIFMRLRLADLRGLPGWAVDGTEISLGIQNVFDKSPPLLATTGASGGYSSYGDPRLRRFSITLRRSF